MPHTKLSAKKIGFVLLSSSEKPQPSTRIAVLNMLPYLREAGLKPEIVFDPRNASETPDLPGLAKHLISENFDVIYFQKVHGASVQSCAKELAESGIRTIHGVCDLIDVEMAELTDLTLTVTDHLRGLYPLHLRHKVRVVHDGIEHADLQKEEWGSNFGSYSQPLHAVLVTSSNLQKLPVLVSPPSWLKVTIVGKYPHAKAWRERFRESRWALTKMTSQRERLAFIRFLANQRIETEMWHHKSVYTAMKNADIGILPIEPIADMANGSVVPFWQLKSENRLTLKMAVGLPVIATPIPSYEPVIQSGINAFLASSNSDWERYLQVLRDPTARREIGSKARTSVIDKYSMNEQAKLLIGAIQSV